MGHFKGERQGRAMIRPWNFLDEISPKLPSSLSRVPPPAMEKTCPEFRPKEFVILRVL